MSKIFVDEIVGNTATAVTIPNLSGTNTLATGSKIAGTDTGSIYAPGMPIQVLSYTFADHIQITSTNFTGVIKDNCNITPKFSNSKILVRVSLQCNHDNNYSGLVRVYRTIGGSTTTIGENNADHGAYWTHVWFNVRSVSTECLNSHSGEYMDSPATTSQITYAVRGMTTGDAEGLCVNRTRADTAHVNQTPAFSAVTLMEIAQ